MRKRSGLFLLAWLVGVAAATIVAQQAPALLAPDAIYYNGKVVTVDQAFSVTEAFAVKGGRFIAVGRNADVRALAGPTTQQVDLRGRAVAPGLLDNHNHQIWKSRNMHRGVSMAGAASIPEMLDRLKRAAAHSRRRVWTPLASRPGSTRS